MDIGEVMPLFLWKILKFQIDCQHERFQFRICFHEDVIKPPVHQFTLKSMKAIWHAIDICFTYIKYM